MSSNYGPQTDEGKARSAQNSLKTGLFAKGDFIRPGEQEEYDELQASFLTDLQPEGGIEEAFTAEIAYSDDVNNGFRSDVNKDRSAATLAFA